MAQAGSLFFDLIPRLNEGALTAAAKTAATTAGTTMGATMGTTAAKTAGPALAAGGGSLEAAAASMGSRIGTALGKPLGAALSPIGDAITWAQGQFGRLPPIVQSALGSIPTHAASAGRALVDTVTRSTAQATESFRSWGGRLRDLVEAPINAISGALGALGVSGSLALAALAGAAVVTGLKFATLKEQSLIAFETMLGSSEKAKEMFESLVQFALKTPFNVTGLVKASQQLLAFGFTAEEIIPTMTAVGDAVAGLGGSTETLNRVTYALGQIMTRGKVMSTEMLQLTQAGIPAWAILANSMKISTSELQDMVSKGLVPASDAIPRLLKGIEEGTDGAAGHTVAFAGLMSKQAQTLTGIWEAFKDRFSEIMGGLIEPVLPTLKSGIEFMLGLFEQVPAGIEFLSTAFAPVVAFITGPLVTAGRNLWDAFGPVILQVADLVKNVFVLAWQAAGGVLTWVGGVLVNVTQWLKDNQWAVAVISGFVLGYVGALTAMNAIMGVVRLVTIAWTAAQWLLNVALNANPIGLIVGILAALVAGLVYAWNNSETFRNVVIGAWEAIKTAVGAVWDFLKGVFDGIVSAGQAAGAGLVAGWNWIRDTAVSIWTGISDTAVSIWTGIGDFFGTVWGGVQETTSSTWTGIGDFLTSTWTSMKDAAALIWNSVTDYFERFYQYHKEMIDGFNSYVTTAWNNVWNGIYSFVQAIWTAISGYFAARWAEFTASWTAFWTAISDFFSAIWTGISAIGQAIWIAISTWFAARWAEFTTAWNAFWTAISDFFTSIWNAISLFAQIIWIAFSTWFAARWAEFTASWNAFWTAISNFFSAIWNGISAVGQTIWNAISGWFAARWGEFTGMWNSFWDGVSAKFNTVWEGIRSAAVGIWEGIKGVFKTGVNAVIGFVNMLTGGGGKTGINMVLDFFLIPLIPAIPMLAAGGQIGSAANGMVTNGPMAIVGEGNPAYPEYVIPTDPKHRTRAMDLFTALGGQLMAEGGILGGIGDVANWIGGGVSGILGAAVNAVKDIVGHGKLADIAGGIVSKIVTGAGARIQQLWDDLQASLAALVTNGVVSSEGTVVGGQGSVAAIVQQTAAQFGWGSGAQWAALAWIINHESGWNPNAQNPTSTAYGLFQFLNGTWGSTGIAKTSDPALQALAGMRYIASRYGTPLGAQAFWQCLTLDAMILTQRGWLTHDEVQVGDLTIGYNPKTERSEWTRITAVHKYDSAPVVELRSHQWHARATANHRWVSRHGVQRRRGAPADVVDGFVTTDKITSRHTLRLAAPADTGPGPAISVTEAALLGWVLGDGTVTRTGGTQPIRIYQNKPRWIETIDTLVKDVPHSHYQYERRGGVEHQWYLRAAYARDLIERSGYDHLDPVPFVLSLSATQRAAFLEAVWQAEGSERRVGSEGRGYGRMLRTIAQADGPSQDAIALAVYLEGYRPGMNRAARIQARHRDMAQITLARPWAGGESLTRIELGEAPVWCVSTELGSWTTEQDGQVFLTGNSHGWYDEGGILPTGWTMAYNGTGKPEMVLTGEQLATLARGGDGPLVGTLYLTAPAGATATEVVDELSFALRHTRRGVHARRR